MDKETDIYQVGDFKAKFSEIIKKVEQGEEITISYGKNKKPVARLVPYKREKKKKHGILLGTLSGKGKIIIKDDFKMTDEEFLGS